jgi:hypothetical protein
MTRVEGSGVGLVLAALPMVKPFQNSLPVTVKLREENVPANSMVPLLSFPIMLSPLWVMQPPPKTPFGPQLRMVKGSSKL